MTNESLLFIMMMASSRSYFKAAKLGGRERSSFSFFGGDFLFLFEQLMERVKDEKTVDEEDRFNQNVDPVMAEEERNENPKCLNGICENHRFKPIMISLRMKICVNERIERNE